MPNGCGAFFHPCEKGFFAGQNANHMTSICCHDCKDKAACPDACHNTIARCGQYLRGLGHPRKISKGEGKVSHIVQRDCRGETVAIWWSISDLSKSFAVTSTNLSKTVNDQKQFEEFYFAKQGVAFKPFTGYKNPVVEIYEEDGRLWGIYKSVNKAVDACGVAREKIRRGISTGEVIDGFIFKQRS